MDFSGCPLGAVQGGCIHQACAFGNDQHRFFVKHGAPSQAPLYRSEWAGLHALERTRTIRVPRPLFLWEGDQRSALVMEWVTLRGEGDWQSLGRALAEMHCQTEDQERPFGFESDGFLGSSVQINTREREWASFFLSHRLAPQWGWAKDRGASFPKMDAVMKKAQRVLSEDSSPCCLLHGDLWSGNAAFDETGAPVVFDPAVYYGDPETDLAMTKLFGGFPEAFYRSYASVRGLRPGWHLREKLYQLYHLLNHFNCFGGSYASSVETILEEILSS